MPAARVKNNGKKQKAKTSLRSARKAGAGSKKGEKEKVEIERDKNNGKKQKAKTSLRSARKAIKVKQQLASASDTAVRAEKPAESGAGSEKDEKEKVEIERAERNGSTTSSTTGNLLLPKDVYCFCAHLLDLEKQENLYLSSKRANAKFHSFLKDVPELDPTFDIAAFQNSFSHIFHWATAPSEFPLIDALERVMDFVQHEHILQRYSGYSKTVSIWNLFLRKFGTSNLSNVDPKLREKFRDKKNKHVMAASEERQQIRRNQKAQLSDFLEKHEDRLFKPQIVYLQQKIYRLEKEMNKYKNFEKSRSELVKQKQRKVVEEKPAENGSDSSEEEDEIERDERAAGSTSSIARNLLLPKDFYCICEHLLEEKQENLHLTMISKRANAKFQSFLKDVPKLDPTLDIDHFQNSFSNIFRWATLPSEFPLIDALKLVMDFVQSEHILQRYCYLKTSNVWSLYLKQFGTSNLNQIDAELKERFKDKTDKHVMAAEEEMQQIRCNHFAQLSDFLEKSKDQLFEPQIAYMRRKVDKLEKEHLDNTGNNKKDAKSDNRPKKKRREEEVEEEKHQQQEDNNISSKEDKSLRLSEMTPAGPLNSGSKQTKKQTAFELYKKTQDEKYLDLPGEKREKKLLRKFDRLDPVQRDAYEFIAKKLGSED